MSPVKYIVPFIQCLTSRTVSFDIQGNLASYRT